MKRKLTFKETIAVGSMLFGMFFGAGNLIFPVHMGQLAGRNVWAALAGFLIIGVGLPVLGVAALGKTKSSGLLELSSKVSKGYGVFFTCALYLTIGPFFAIPRCATTSFTVGLEPIIGENAAALFAFSAVFFGIALYFSLKPNGILTWIGKILNPAFLLFFCTLIVVALLNPMAPVASVVPEGTYADTAFFNGFLEGYNTMDALAGLAFGIVVVNVIASLGVKDGDDIAAGTFSSGAITCVMMAVIYLGACIIGVQSRGGFETSANGGIALAQICSHYFGKPGQIFLTATVTLACLKTSIGLITSISQTFAGMFTKGEGYKYWAIGFSLFSFGVSNVGLSKLISISIPVLMFLYPLAVTLIVLAICSSLFKDAREVYVSVTALTLIAALFDFFNALGVGTFNPIAQKILPLFSLGLGWVVPALVGLAAGLVWKKLKKA